MSEIMKPNEDLLSAIIGAGETSAHEDVTGSVRNHLIAKINYEDCGLPKGVWVIGQRKDQSGNVEECGRVIGTLGKAVKTIDGADFEILLQKNAIVPLVIRQRYNFYSEKNQSLNCHSPLIRNLYQEVHGSTHGYQCGNSCPYRDKNLNDRCRLEFVLFGLAISDEGREEPVVMYIKGASYIPFDDWKKSATIGKFDIGGKTIEKPVRLCTYYLTLGSVPRKKGMVNYFQGYFEKGDMIGSKEQFERYVALADELIASIEEQEREDIKENKPVLVPPKAEKLEGSVITGDMIEDEDDIPINCGIPQGDGGDSEVDKMLQEINALKKKKQ